MHGSTDANAKYSIAHSHAWTTGCSDLANCKFTLMQYMNAEPGCRGGSETKLVNHSQLNSGRSSLKAVKIDLLLTETQSLYSYAVCSCPFRLRQLLTVSIE